MECSEFVAFIEFVEFVEFIEFTGWPRFEVKVAPTQNAKELENLPLSSYYTDCQVLWANRWLLNVA